MFRLWQLDLRWPGNEVLRLASDFFLLLCSLGKGSLRQLSLMSVSAGCRGLASI